MSGEKPCSRKNELTQINTSTDNAAMSPSKAQKTKGGGGEGKKGKDCKVVWHPGFDARFPNQNQTRRCWQNYVDYFRCQEIHGEDYEPCEFFKKTYTYLCPADWIEKWNDQRDEGTFPMPRWQ